MKVLEKVYQALAWTVTIVVAVLACLLAVPRLLGIQYYVVLSGSMEPTYKTGALIYVKPEEPETIEVDDPITFVLNDELTVVTHRVVEVDRKEGCFYTKGDANEAIDNKPVLYENLIGKAVFSIPYVGYVVHSLNNASGRILIVTAVIAAILLTVIIRLLRDDERG